MVCILYLRNKEGGEMETEIENGCKNKASVSV